MFQTKVVEKIKTHFVFSNFFFLFENRAVYEIMCKNIVEPDRPQMTIWRMGIACWITKATDAHSEYVTRCFFHCNNGCRNVLHSYVVLTLSVLFSLQTIMHWSVPVYRGTLSALSTKLVTALTTETYLPLTFVATLFHSHFNTHGT